VLDQVLAHVAADHGLVRPPLPFIESVLAHTQPFVPPRVDGSTPPTPAVRGTSSRRTGTETPGSLLSRVR
jgi:hypothetical protein